MSPNRNRATLFTLAIVLGLAILFGALYWFVFQAGMLDDLCDCIRLHGYIIQWGRLGPLAVIGLMALAIVISPIPSAPIALASGMAYGPLWGTAYIVIGAEAGAMIAFFIARLLGYEAMQKRFGDRLSVGLLGSQNVMTGIVLVLRLIPFISFDMVSYAAGVTSLKPWRFSLATLIGVTPVSFILAYFGDELATWDFNRTAWIAVALGFVTLIPLLAVAIRRGKGSREQGKASRMR